jgi:hypothetical protein
MADPVHQYTASKSSMATPPAMMPSQHIGKFFARAAPKIVIDSLRRILHGIGCLRLLVSWWQPDFDGLQFAERTGSNQRNGLSELGPASLLRSGLKDGFTLLDLAANFEAFGKPMRDRLFTVDGFGRFFDRSDVRLFVT